VVAKHNIIVIAISLAIAAAIPLVYLYRGRHQEEKISYKTFRLNSGWGYDIVENGKMIIHQVYIPAIPEKREFSTEGQAKQTAKLVVAKLRNNQFPTLSKTEVEQICSENN